MMNTKTARAAWLAVSALIGLVLFGVSTVHAQQLALQESESNLTRFRVTVPVNVTRMQAELTAVTVDCQLMAGPNDIRATSDKKLLTLNADGSYSGNVTFIWGVNATMLPANVFSAAQVTADSFGVSSARCTLGPATGATVSGTATSSMGEPSNFIVTPRQTTDPRVQVLPNPTPVLSVTGNFPVTSK